MRSLTAQLDIYWRAFGVLVISCAVYGVWAYAAHAQGAITYGQSFSCSGGQATGELFSLSSRCPQYIGAGGSIDLEHIFSFFVCNIEHITTALFGNLYCGIITSLAPGVYAVATMAVMFFGVGFTTGILDFTARELLGFLMKIVLFIVFTTEADYMIGVAYNFFITGTQNGIAIAMGALYEGRTCGGTFIAGGTATSSDLYCFLDNFFYRFLSDTTMAVGVDPETGANPCQNALFAALGILAIAFPPVFYMSLLILVKIAMVFMRGVFGYMFSIVGLAFLMVISPIYLTFGLFRQTRPLFDKFLGYLASFSLQMIFVFTFLAFVLSLPLSHVSNSLLSVIVYDKTTYTGNSWRWPWEYCSICEFDVYDINGTPNENGDDILQPEGTKLNSAKHRLQCKDPIKALQPLALVSPQPDGSGQNPVAQGQQLQHLLMDFAMYGLLGLLVLGLVIDKLLSLIPFLAQSISAGMGASYAPMIGGGQEFYGRKSVQMPFESSINAFGEGFDRGFSSGYRDADGNMVRPATSLEGLAYGVSEGSKDVIAGNGRDPGLVGGMVRFFVNPQAGAPGDND